MLTEFLNVLSFLFCTAGSVFINEKAKCVFLGTENVLKTPHNVYLNIQ